MNYFTYLVFVGFITIFRILPFSLLYIISDLLYFIVYHLVGYRKKVVFGNLRNSFPEKSEEEIRKIAKGFYHHLCDLFVESIKSFTMKEADVVERYIIGDTGNIDDFQRQGKNAICAGGHYGNWEWSGIATGSQMLYLPVGFYKPLSNKWIDAYIRKRRVKGRARLVSITNTAAVFAASYGEPAFFYMIADQSPSSPRVAYWVNFLNQDTAVLHGIEKYARLLNLPVVFVASRKIRRGYYKVTFTLIVEDPSKTKRGEITEKYMRALEDLIREKPEFYLWSHKRWKHKRI
ncbi:MAG: lysophospholipid acyltransferase family protein [Bacteroidetes bacterium]|nr:lysophospholipid acyltransferase family protein [Bacteroidota bacterium]